MILLALDIAERQAGTKTWRLIPGYETYEVSEFGDVRRVINGGSPIAKAGRALKPNRWGKYLRVCLHHNQKREWHSVHRLVALAFIGPPLSSKHEIAHYDGDCWNNHYSNLRWATSKENAADRLRHGTVKRGEEHGFSRLSKLQVNAIREAYKKGLSQEHIAALVETSQSHIGRIVRGEAWRDDK